MRLRQSLEALQERLRNLKWMADGKATQSQIQMEAAFCSDCIGEILDRLDDNLLLRTSVALDCTADVRYSRRPKCPEEIKLLIEMLNLTQGAFERRNRNEVAQTGTSGTGELDCPITQADLEAADNARLAIE